MCRMRSLFELGRSPILWTVQVASAVFPPVTALSIADSASTRESDEFECVVPSHFQICDEPRRDLPLPPYHVNHRINQQFHHERGCQSSNHRSGNPFH